MRNFDEAIQIIGIMIKVVPQRFLPRQIPNFRGSVEETESQRGRFGEERGRAPDNTRCAAATDAAASVVREAATVPLGRAGIAAGGNHQSLWTSLLRIEHCHIHFGNSIQQAAPDISVGLRQE